MTRTPHNPPETALLSITDLEQLQYKTTEQNLRSRHHTIAPTIGQRPSIFRGHGMELEDVRAYQSGDDVRHMDWRATARSGKPTMKVFREERSQGLFLMIDRRASMNFGTRGELKATTAARSAAILAFSALAAHDWVAGMIVETDEQFFSGVRDINNVLRLLQAASAPLPKADKHAIPMSTLLIQINRAAERGASIFLISDFKDLREEHAPLLLQLTTAHEVWALHVIDPAEEMLPAAGKLRMASPNGETFVIDTTNASLRARYAQAMTKQHADLARLFSRTGITLQRLYTHKDTFEQLTCHG